VSARGTVRHRCGAPSHRGSVQRPSKVVNIFLRSIFIGAARKSNPKTHGSGGGQCGGDGAGRLRLSRSSQVRPWSVRSHICPWGLSQRRPLLRRRGKRKQGKERQGPPTQKLYFFPCLLLLLRSLCSLSFCLFVVLICAAAVGGGGRAFGLLAPGFRRGRDQPGASDRGGRPPTWRGGALKPRPISNSDTLPNHALPLARFGSPPMYVAAAWCGPITTMPAREVGALNNMAGLGNNPVQVFRT
jgi:hypothetical protein